MVELSSHGVQPIELMPAVCALDMIADKRRVAYPFLLVKDNNLLIAK